MATARELFFVRLSIWLVNGGIITLRAWGRITKFNTRGGLSPIAMAASFCPLLTD